MANKELAKIFNEIADFLAADKVEFKPFAYRKAARALEDLQEDVAAIYGRGGLKAVEDIPGIGESTGQKIEEYIKKGKIGYYEKLKHKLPVNWEELTGVEGVGPKRAKLLYRELGIRDLADLEVPTAPGHQKLSVRDAPTVLDAGFQTAKFWDGRAADLLEQARMAVVQPRRDGDARREDMRPAARSDCPMPAMFREAFDEDDPITLACAAMRAIAAYEHTLISRCRFDDYMAGDEQKP